MYTPSNPAGRVQSSYYPPEWHKSTYNDLACHHASRGAEGMYRRMMAMAREAQR
jgi:hypothetical protein